MENNYLGFAERVAAALIDLFLQSLVLLPIVLTFFPDLLEQKTPNQNFQWVAAAVQTAMLVGFWLYNQSTPGKMLFKAKIVDATTGQAPSTQQLLLRYLGYILSSMALGVGFIWAAFDARHQGWHDKLGNTVVIKGNIKPATHKDSMLA
ncbi:RDD family protein [Agitococcus lubricus]|uniref:Putative RDD family membrane protein YckC n=1 Tax=Agitococcus lubricus TaxID=1077255 RepID=A0A2T5IZ88_9GAMM|nr:RDD family protein [Agitococcus lubricus]PTQ89325.1 putative RDD family membrane protein YckC [Agitococcus lubricus]